jgi:hypothetical protein
LEPHCSNCSPAHETENGSKRQLENRIEIKCKDYIYQHQQEYLSYDACCVGGSPARHGKEARLISLSREWLQNEITDEGDKQRREGERWLAAE